MASGFRKFFGNIASAALPLAGYAFGGPVGAAVGGAAGGALNGKGALKNAAIGGAAGYGGGSLLNNFGLQGGGGNFLGGLGSMLSKFNPFSSGTAYAAPAQTTAQSIPNPGAGSALNYFLPSGYQPSNFTPLPSGDGGGGLLNKFGGLIKKNPLASLGLGAMGLGMFTGRTPQVPDLPPSVEEYRNLAKSGGTPLGQLGQNKLTDLLNQDFQQVSGDEEAAITRNVEDERAREIDRVKDLYRNLRPGSDPSSDSAFGKDMADVNKRYDQMKNDTLYQYRRQISQDFNNSRLQQIIASSAQDAQSQAALQQVAQWDVDRIALEFGIKREDAQYLKDFLMKEGALLINTGLQQEFAPDTVNPFQGMLSAFGV